MPPAPKHARATEKHIVAALLDRHGTTYAEELGIDLARNTPAPLFRWLCATLLLSARISSRIAMEAAGALAREGWTTPQKLAASTWRRRVTVLNHAGYARYDESAARMLGETTDMLLTDYGGDLRRLREAAHRDPAEERKRLKAFKGIGDVGVDIFFREIQPVWTELYPFADRKALSSAARLGLPDKTDALAKTVSRKTFPRLLTALVRADLAKDHADIRQTAAEKAK